MKICIAMVWHTWSVVGRPESSIVTQSYYWPFNWPKGALAFDNGDDDELDIGPPKQKEKTRKNSKHTLWNENENPLRQWMINISMQSRMCKSKNRRRKKCKKGKKHEYNSYYTEFNKNKWTYKKTDRWTDGRTCLLAWGRHCLTGRTYI